MPLGASTGKASASASRSKRTAVPLAHAAGAPLSARPPTERLASSAATTVPSAKRNRTGARSRMRTSACCPSSSAAAELRLRRRAAVFWMRSARLGSSRSSSISGSRARRTSRQVVVARADAVRVVSSKRQSSPSSSPTPIRASSCIGRPTLSRNTVMVPSTTR